MDDGEKNTNMEKNLSRQSLSTVPNDSIILQPFWVRCGAVWTNLVDRKFMESQLRVVLYCGTIFWVVYLLSQII